MLNKCDKEILFSDGVKQQEAPYVSLWSRSGEILLLGAFAILLFKNVPAYWPLICMAFFGYLLIRLLKKTGLFLSLTILACVAVIFARSMQDSLWVFVFSGSVAFSLWLIFMGGKELECFVASNQEKVSSLEEKSSCLEKQVREEKESASMESKKNQLKIDELNAVILRESTESDAQLAHLDALHAQTTSALMHEKLFLEVSEKERMKLDERCQLLISDIASLQHRENELLTSLEEAKLQLINVEETTAVVSDENQNEESCDDELRCLTQVKHQHALLREQFEEKSDALNQARQELFKMENNYLALQKQWEERALEAPLEDFTLQKELKGLEEECEELESQVIHLQEIISSLLAPKKRAPIKKQPEKNKKTTASLLQNLIDQNTIVNSDSIS